MSGGPVMINFRFECAGFEPMDELIVVEEDQQPIYGWEKGLTILGNKGKIEIRFDPPLAAVYDDGD